MAKEYDVVVIGGGTSGVVAAIQAGRAGARTLLIEKAGILGGTITNAGINFPGLFHAWGHQVIAGIGWELVSRCVSEAGTRMPDFSDYDRPHYQLQVRVNPFIYAALCDEFLLDAGVEILLHAMPGVLDFSGQDRVWKVTVCTKTGLKDLYASVLVDATGDANAVSLAGFPVNVPEENQPSTLSCRTSGYDPAGIDYDSVNKAYEIEVKAGRLSYTDACWNTKRSNVAQWLRSGGNNASHIHQINARDSEGKTELELESRKSLMRLYRFLRTQPGLENFVIDSVSPECGVRETATIRGKSVVTESDYVTGRLWDDAVCYAFYPIDLHVSQTGGLRGQPLVKGVVPTVPLRALLPAGSNNLVAAGRCISSDRLANSALRVEATCMAAGQAAGAVAALSAFKSVDPEALEIDEVGKLLLEHGAIVPSQDFSESIQKSET